MAFKQHQKSCGVDKPRPFKCDTCGKCFTRKATLEDHQKIHQKGGAVKRKVQDQSDESPSKKVKLPEKADEVFPVDKEVSAMKGTKVDAIFYQKQNRSEKINKCFLKRRFPDFRLTWKMFSKTRKQSNGTSYIIAHWKCRISIVKSP